MSDGSKNYVQRPHRAIDYPLVAVGKITHGGPTQWRCRLSPVGWHRGCEGCNGLGWYVESAQITQTRRRAGAGEQRG